MKDSKPTLHIIVAIAEDGAIGFEGDMPWGRNLPRDLKHFKETTMGYPIVMGRKTFESLPKGALPGRLNIVISRNTAYEAQGATVVHSIDEALSVAKGVEHLFIIGGGELYRQSLPYADILHITQVHAHFEGADTFFPPIDIGEWHCVASDEHPTDDRNLYAVTFTEWHRTKR